jgi:hypothetical protein
VDSRSDCDAISSFRGQKVLLLSANLTESLSSLEVTTMLNINEQLIVEESISVEADASSPYPFPLTLTNCPTDYAAICSELSAVGLI